MKTHATCVRPYQLLKWPAAVSRPPNNNWTHDGASCPSKSVSAIHIQVRIICRSTHFFFICSSWTHGAQRMFSRGNMTKLQVRDFKASWPRSMSTSTRTGYNYNTRIGPFARSDRWKWTFCGNRLVPLARILTDVERPQVFLGMAGSWQLSHGLGSQGNRLLQLCCQLGCQWYFK